MRKLLHKSLYNSFSESEVKHIIFLLNIKLDKQPEGLSELIIALLEYCENHKKTHELVNEMIEARPHLEKLLLNTTNVLLISSLPNPQAKDFFIGRKKELEQLQIALDNQQSVSITAVLEGMAGVGKSYLVDHFALNSPRQYRYEILALNPLGEETPESLIGQLAERLQVLPDYAAVRHALKAQNVLLHIENIDTETIAKVAMQLVAQLQGCRLVLSGRFKDLGRGKTFKQIQLKPFGEADGIKQLQEELEWLNASPLPHETLKKLVTALDGLPLAIHLCAGYLANREGYKTAEDFLKELHNTQLCLESQLLSDASNRNRQHCTLHAAFSVSFLAFTHQHPEHKTTLPALGFCYARDIGFSLAHALLNCPEETAKTLLYQASKLGLLMEIREKDKPLRWRVHPLIAQYLRTQATDCQAIEQRLTDWFMQRLPRYDTDEGYQAWRELNQEQDALRTWLERVLLEQGQTIERAGSSYADLNGSWTSWRQLCEKLLATSLTDEARSDVLWTACRCSANLGDLDQSYQFAEQKAQLDQRLGNERGYAIARWQISDILQRRGKLDEALEILQTEVLPAFKRINDERHIAVMYGYIADILKARGELDEALRIRQEEEMPVYERLGDVRARAVTLGKIADILQARGELDEALRIRQEEQMPVYERLGDVRSLLITQVQIAILFMQFSSPRRTEANQLLCQALQSAQKMRIPEAGQIEAILQDYNMDY
ncbi:NB-ARC domain-containing protein [Beggiatoa alba B18LD]|uniref:NB-ARC domain-containing protein n=1 Tax=Beggiatoa alba B18LD TaxID=395493 RepID=I3CG26_9GAMM|nr:NB-ARC domain-containing protein [Beggiatoa alba]EIJ42569.1 NB-ARC domain-containing protein [Beggiatoa alba B18LD]